MLLSGEHERSRPEKLGEKFRRHEVLCFKFAKTVHNVTNESYGFSSVAKFPENKVGINIGYCCAVRIGMSSIAISDEGARGSPLSTVLATATLKERK